MARKNPSARKNSRRLTAREIKVLEIVRENDRRKALAEVYNEQLADFRDALKNEHKGILYTAGQSWPVVYPDLLDMPELE